MTEGRWLAGWEPRPEASVTLVVVPHALGGPSAFRSWLPLLPAWADLRVASFPGRERRIGEEPVTRLEVLAEGLVQAVAEEVDTPVALFGHSQGALVAFEAARRIEAAGLPLVQFVASGCWAPHLHRPHPALPDPDAGREVLLNSLVAVGGVPAQLVGDESMVDVMIRLWRADVAVTRGYRYHAAFPPLRAPLAAFGGTGDALFPPEGLLGWEAHTAGGFSTRMFPGDHFYFDGERAAVVAALAELLATRSSTVSSRSPGRL